MLQTFTGDNSFALDEAVHRIVDDFVDTHGDFSLERIDGQEASYETMQAAVTAAPFLTDQKLVVLRAPSASKEFTEKLPQLAAQIPDTVRVLIIEPHLDKRASYYKYLQKNTDFQMFAVLDQPSIARWATNYANASGATLSIGDAQYLVERVGGNQQQLAHEIDKLALHNAKITRQSIDILTDQTPQSTTFQLLDAAFAGRSARVLELYAEQRALKVEPIQIIALLAWQLHILALLQAAGDRSVDAIARETKLSPFALRKSSAIAKKLSRRSVRESVDRLAAIDRQLKSAPLDGDEALQHFLLSLSQTISS